MMFLPYLLIFLVSYTQAASSTKRFIIRLDDIQDWYNSAIQIDLLNFFMNRGVRIAVGVIGDFLSGNDINLFQTVQQCVSLGANKCTLFNHGANAEYLFGSSTSVDTQKLLIQSCDRKVKDLFNNYQMEVFVPHQNSWNEYTLLALQELEYKIISASIQDYSNMVWDMTTNPLQMPQQTSTAVYVPPGTWVASPLTSTVDDCNTAAGRGEVCVIMVHPQEFASGAYNLTMLESLLDTLMNIEGFTATSFHSMINEIVPVPHETIIPTFLPTLIPSLTINNRNTTKEPTQSPSTSESGPSDSSNSGDKTTSTDDYQPTTVVLVGIICGGFIFLAILGLGARYYYQTSQRTIKKPSVGTNSDLEQGIHTTNATIPRIADPLEEIQEETKK